MLSISAYIILTIETFLTMVSLAEVNLIDLEQKLHIPGYNSIYLNGWQGSVDLYFFIFTFFFVPKCFLLRGIVIVEPPHFYHL